MAEEFSAREQALRKLPLPYSLALRLRDSGAAPDVISEYVGVEEPALDGLFCVAEAKLAAAQRLYRGDGQLSRSIDEQRW